MNTWLDWFRTHLHWFVFLILEGASLVMLFRFSIFHKSVWTTQTNALAGTVLQWEADWHSYLDLRDINKALVRENLVLQTSNERLRNRIETLTHDTNYVEQLMLNHLEAFKVIPAHVVDNSIRRRDNILTLDKGRLDGVRNEMGVVSGTGIVGIIYEVSDHFSLVLPVLNSRSNISCRLRGTNYFGSLHWKGGNPLDAYIDDIPRHARFRVGDVVETSGYSSVFPAGIFVGRVMQVLNSPDGLSYELKVRLSTDLANLYDVNIIDNPFKEELDSLHAKALPEVKE
ncbi:MAG: rod shape-determining protein MreC [Bacteroidales bacterium]|nr:rod shape-determining protein MreC [Candidatus Physcousia equi]